MPYYSASDGTRLHYTDEGQGTPILCLAGLTRNGEDFQHVKPHLQGRVICPDYRGRGLSEWADHSTYTVPTEAKDVLALMDHLKIDKAAILGTSRGGIIAMLLAITAKDRLLGVALNDIGPEISEAGMKPIYGYIGKQPTQKTYAEAADFRARHWAHFSNVPQTRWLAEAAAQYEQTDQGLRLRYDPRLRDAVLELAKTEQPDLWPLFDALADLPLALIRGANSDLLTVETTDKMRARRPDMIVAEVPDRGHVPFLDEEQALTALSKWQNSYITPQK